MQTLHTLMWMCTRRVLLRITDKAAFATLQNVSSGTKQSHVQYHEKVNSQDV